MKIVHILIVLVIAALTLGCIGNKQAETKSVGTTVQPTQTSVGTTIQPSQTTISSTVTAVPGVDDPFGTDMDVAALDTMLADSTMDISLMDSI